MEQYLALVEKPVVNGIGLAVTNGYLRNDRSYGKNFALGAGSSVVGMLGSKLTNQQSLQPLMDGIGYAVVNGVMNRENFNLRNMFVDVVYGTGVSATTIGVTNLVGDIVNAGTHGALYNSVPVLNSRGDNYI